MDSTLQLLLPPTQPLERGWVGGGGGVCVAVGGSRGVSARCGRGGLERVWVL